MKCFPGTQRSANFEAAVRYAIRLVQKKLQSRNHLALALEYFDLQTKDHDCWAISKWSQYFSNNTRPRFPAAADKIVDHQGSDKVKKNVTSWKAFLYGWDIILGNKTNQITTQQKLSKVQRLGLINIKGAIRTTPTSALELIIGIKPLHIIIKERLWKKVIKSSDTSNRSFLTNLKRQNGAFNIFVFLSY